VTIEERVIDRELVLRGVTTEQILMALGALRWTLDRKLHSGTVFAGLIEEAREKLNTSLAAATIEQEWTSEEIEQMGEEMDKVRATFGQENR